jgi:hypothetical protein
MTQPFYCLSHGRGRHSESTSTFSCPLTTCYFVVVFIFSGRFLLQSIAFIPTFRRYFRLQNVSPIHVQRLCSMAKFWSDLPVCPTHFSPHLHYVFLCLYLFHYTRRSIRHSPQPQRRNGWMGKHFSLLNRQWQVDTNVWNEELHNL